MSETWADLSNNSIDAAILLLKQGSYRGAVNRAYYAAYSAATDRITRRLATFGPRNNPAHELVPEMIQNNTTLPVGVKRGVTRRYRSLYKARLDADYRPHVSVDREVAINSVRDASYVRSALGAG